jgi:hypothetical protein
VSQGVRLFVAKGTTPFRRGPAFMADPGLMSCNMMSGAAKRSLGSQIPVSWLCLAALFHASVVPIHRCFHSLDSAMSVDPALTGSPSDPWMPVPLVVRWAAALCGEGGGMASGSYAGVCGLPTREVAWGRGAVLG